MTSTPTIEAQGLTKTYPGGVEAVRGIDFDVASGEVFGLLGPNGAGKSTTVGMLTTAVAPTDGFARLGGFDVARQPLAARQISAVVFQDPVVDRPLTGRRNLMIHARLWGLDIPTAHERIDAVVTAFGLADLVDRPVATYSGGQRRRLEIARALISQPQVLFLDEPTVGLDPRIRHELLDLVAGLRASSGMTILLTTHYLDEAEELCDRVAVIHGGCIVAIGRPAALLASLGPEIVELRLPGHAGAALERVAGHGLAVADAFAVGSTVMFPTRERSADDLIAAVADRGLDVVSLTRRPPTLDDIYLQLTGASLAE